MIKFLFVFCFFSLVLSLRAQEAKGHTQQIRHDKVKSSPGQTIIREVTSDDKGYKSYRKEVCPFTGEVIYSEVEYSAREGRYVPATSGKCGSPQNEVPVRNKLSAAPYRPGADGREILSEKD